MMRMDFVSGSRKLQGLRLASRAMESDLKALFFVLQKEMLIKINSMIEFSLGKFIQHTWSIY